MISTRAGLLVIAILDVVVIVILSYTTLMSVGVYDSIRKRDENLTETTTKEKQLEDIKQPYIEDTIRRVTVSDRSLLPNTERKKYNLDQFFENEQFTVITYNETKKNNSPDVFNKSLDTCPETPPGLVGLMKVPNNIPAPSWAHIQSQNTEVQNGSHAPSNCRARFKVAIIIPLRDREEHLRILLYHLHPILQRQQIDYTIYTITLAGKGIFNRAKIMNAGFAEAIRDREYDCYVFHDVDLLLENDKCLYWCSNQPRQLAFHMDKFGYHPLSYSLGCRTKDAPSVNKYFGGVAQVPHQLFLKVNGFSNIFWGWGGEDDDMYSRLWSKGHDIVNPYGRQCSFSMIKHERESSNSVNPARFTLLYHTVGRMDNEGLNTLRYKRISVERHQLYTNITVDVGSPSKAMEDFMNSKFNGVACNKVRTPWD